MLPSAFPSGEHTVSGFQNLKIHTTIHLNKSKQSQSAIHRIYSKPSFGEIKLVKFLFHPLDLVISHLLVDHQSTSLCLFTQFPLLNIFIHSVIHLVCQLMFTMPAATGESVVRKFRLISPLTKFMVQCGGEKKKKHDPNNLTNDDKLNTEKNKTCCILSNKLI